MRNKQQWHFWSILRLKHNASKSYISAALENVVTRKMYSSIGFKENKEVEYSFLDKHFREIQMVKESQ